MAAIFVMGIFVILQAGHVFEHIAQLVQKFVLGMPVAQGILGAMFDTEWVHFLFNVVTQSGLLVVFLLWRRAGASVPTALWVAMAVQGVHTIEHVAKMYQYYALGITVGASGNPGLLLPPHLAALLPQHPTSRRNVRSLAGPAHHLREGNGSGGQLTRPAQRTTEGAPGGAPSCF
ncbi:MAG: hypothetical protein HY334_01715 [Armatimonadetes bacterium]|nr:hypothetical protein [Armatimonadota bacterium]